MASTLDNMTKSTTVDVSKRDVPKYDVIVVGGGAAGLSGAKNLARARRSVLVVDDGQPRNAPAGHIHNYLAREGTPPLELLAIGRREAAEYGGEVVSGRVSATSAIDGGFEVTLADGKTVQSRRLLVATGLVDRLPDVPGVADRWGRDVLHCPYCHGWEVRDQAIVILATNPMSMHQALLFRQLSSDVTVLLHNSTVLSDDELEQLAARDIAVVEDTATGLTVVDDRLTGVQLASGGVLECQAVVVAPRFEARVDFLAGLGLQAQDIDMGGHVFGTAITADANGATSVPGVWAAGNVSDMSAQVIVAAARGVAAAAQINADLVLEDTRLAVAARRALASV